MSDSACSAQLSSAQFLPSKMRSQTVPWLALLLLLSRLSSGCMPVPGLGPDDHSDNRGDFHEEPGGDIFSHGERPDFGFEGFQHDGFGFDFGEGFSHDEGEDGGYERRVRLRHEREQEDHRDRRVPVYGYEDRQEEEEKKYRKGEEYEGYNYRKTQFDHGF